MNLYELTSDFKQLQTMDFDQDSQMYKDTLDSIEQPIQEKGKNICLVLANLKGNCDSLDTEIKRLQAMKKVKQNNIKNLKDWLLYNMQFAGIEKIQSDLFTITLRKASKGSLVVIEDENLIKDDYKKVTYSVNKTLIKQAIKDGYVVKGAKLIDGNRSILIK